MDKLAHKNPFTNQKKKPKRKRMSRLPRHKRGKKKHFLSFGHHGGHAFSHRSGHPLIKALRVPDVVPSSALSLLGKYASSDKNGAVQKIKVVKGQKETGYTVIVADEKALTDANLTTKSTDFGELSASIHKELIEAVTTRADSDHGKICIVPSHNTLENISQYPTLSHVIFHWGLFLSSFEDSDNNQVMVLDNTVTLDDLEKIDKNHPKMYRDQDTNKLVVGHTVSHRPHAHYVDDGSKAMSDEPSGLNRSNEASRPSGASTEAQSSSVSSRDTGVAVAPGRGLGKNGATVSNIHPKPQADSSNGSSQGSNLADLVSNSLGDSDQGSVSNRSSSGSRNLNGRTNPMVAPTPRQNVAPNSADSGSGSSAGQSQESSAPQPSLSVDPNLASNDPLLAQMSASGVFNANNASNSSNRSNASQSANETAEDTAFNVPMDSSNDMSGTRESRLNEPSEPKQTAQDYVDELEDYTNKTIYDPSLGVHISSKNVLFGLGKYKPRQIPLYAEHPHDYLAKMLNSRVKQMNQTLLEMHRQHDNDIYENAMNSIGALSNSLNRIFDINSDSSVAGKRMKKIEAEYKDYKQNAQKKAKIVQKQADNDYKQDRAAYVRHVKARIESEYDSQHHHGLDQHKADIKNLLLGRIQKGQLQAKNNLNKWRKAKAQEIVDHDVNVLRSIVNNANESNHSKEQAYYDHCQAELGKIKERHFDAQSRRIQAENDSKQHDHKVSDLQRDNQALIKKYEQRNRETINKYEQQIKQIKAREALRSQHAAQANQQRISQITADKKRIEDKIADVRREVASEFEHRMKAKDDVIKGMKDQWQKDSEQSAYEIRRTHKANDALRRRTNRSLSNMRHVVDGMRANQDDKNNITNNNWGKLAILSVVGLLCVAGGYMVHGQTSPQLSTQQTSMASSSKSEASSVASSASSMAQSASSASASASEEAEDDKRSDSHDHDSDNRGNSSNHGDSLMTTRPRKESGRYIGTSTKHSPTNFMYVKDGDYKAGHYVTGYQNGHEVMLKVESANNGRIYVKDGATDQSYEFNA